MEDCVFCRIVKGELPCHKIYEDDQFLAFLDIAPFVDGHTQVIPKSHFRWVWEVPNIGGYFSVVRKVVIHYQKALGDDFAAGIVWGQMVGHAHIQVLPSPKKIDLTWERENLTEEKALSLLKKLSFK